MINKSIKLSIFLVGLVLVVSGCAANSEENQNQANLNSYNNNSDNMSVVAGESINEENEENMNQENQTQQENTLVKLKTSKGDISIELFNNDAPNTVKNFLSLASNNFYNQTTFHRVIPNFMIQGGDPLSKDGDPLNDGTGGPGYIFDDEINDHKIVRGTLAMANAGANTNGSQFFIVTAQATPWLDGVHTVFGKVVEGMDVVEAISLAEKDGRDRPLEDIVIESVEITVN